MKVDFDEIVTHDSTDQCVACRAQDMASLVLVPATEVWELTAELPRFSLALHGAAGLLGGMLAEGVPRGEIEEALSGLLDQIEQQIAEERVMGGPPQGNA